MASNYCAYELRPSGVRGIRRGQKDTLPLMENEPKTALTDKACKGRVGGDDTLPLMDKKPKTALTDKA